MVKSSFCNLDALKAHPSAPAQLSVLSDSSDGNSGEVAVLPAKGFRRKFRFLTNVHKAQKDLISLKAEILACIKGESVFPKETLAEMITAQEEKLRELDALYESSYAETEKTAELMDNVSKLYEELISFSDLYDSASFEAKKMIVNQLIRRVDVYRGYQLNITFNFDLTPYIEGDDAAAC